MKARFAAVHSVAIDPERAWGRKAHQCNSGRTPRGPDVLALPNPKSLILAGER
jgi:hypothetical protein